LKPEDPLYGPINQEEHRSLLVFGDIVDTNFDLFWKNSDLESQTYDTASFILKSLENCVKVVRPHTVEGVLAHLPGHVVFGMAAMFEESRLAEERPIYPGLTNARIRREAQRVIEIAQAQSKLENYPVLNT
jgi:hypothetical protein